MATKPQSYDNHRRFVPLYHQVLALCLLINFAWAIRRVVRLPDGDNVVNLVLAIAIVLTALFARTFALRAQDRVIRLEMRLRMLDLLPDELRHRIHEFTPRQLIALRFASDGELPTLAAGVLRDRIDDPTAIKKMIKTWLPDDLRV